MRVRRPVTFSRWLLIKVSFVIREGGLRMEEREKKLSPSSYLPAPPRRINQLRKILKEHAQPVEDRDL